MSAFRFVLVPRREPPEKLRLPPKLATRLTVANLGFVEGMDVRRWRLVAPEVACSSTKP
jgi:hypothetical protein